MTVEILLPTAGEQAFSPQLQHVAEAERPDEL